MADWQCSDSKHLLRFSILASTIYKPTFLDAVRMDRRFVSTAVGRYDSLNRRFRREVKVPGDYSDLS